MVDQTIALDILREGEQKTLKATVKEVQKPVVEPSAHPRLSGATFGDIEASSPQYGKVAGVMVYSVKHDSPAQYSGLRPEDIITSVNKQAVSSLEDFKPLVQNNRTLLLNITRDKQTLYLFIR